MSSKTVTLARSQSASRRAIASKRSKDNVERHDTRTWQPFTMDMAPRPPSAAPIPQQQPLALDAERQRIIQVQRLQAQQQQHQFLSQQLQLQIHLQQQQLLANRLHRARSGEDLSQVEASATQSRPAPLPVTRSDVDLQHLRDRSMDSYAAATASKVRLPNAIEQSGSDAISSARSRDICKPVKARKSPETSTHPLQRARGNSQPDLPLKRKSPQLNVLSGLSPLSPTTPLPGERRTSKSATTSPATSFVDLAQAANVVRKRGSQTSLTTISNARSSPRRNASSPSLLITGIGHTASNGATTQGFSDELEEDALGAITFRPRLQRRRIRPSDGDDSSIGFAGGSERSDYDAKRSKALSARRRADFDASSSIGFSSPTEDDTHSDSALGLTFGKGSFATRGDAFGRSAISSPEATNSVSKSATVSECPFV